MRVLPHSVLKLGTSEKAAQADLLAVEAPLSVRLDYVHRDRLHQRELMVTMRTPGHDEELLSGFLFAEGLITSATDLASLRRCPELPPNEQANRLIVRLRDGIVPELDAQQRYGTINSACGVCGKTLLENLNPPWDMSTWWDHAWPAERLLHLPEALRASQPIFSRTGGLHGVGLFDRAGHAVLVREDIGRHNALDKVLGAALHQGLLPLRDYTLVLSGRIGYEMVQKSLMAGCPVLVAVGAPSSLAVQLAEAHHQTVVGFVRGGKGNLYTHADRVEN